MTSLIVENIQHLAILGPKWCKALENSQMKGNINNTEFFASLYGSLTLQTFWLQVFVLLAFANQNASFFQNIFWKVNTYRNHLAKEHNGEAFGRLLSSFHVLLFIYLLKFWGFAVFQLGTEYYWEVHFKIMYFSSILFCASPPTEVTYVPVCTSIYKAQALCYIWPSKKQGMWYWERKHRLNSFPSYS